MKRHTYYNLLLFGPSFILVYSILGILSFSLLRVHLPRPYFGYLMDLFVLFILVFETLHARKLIVGLNLFLMLLVFVGRLFIIMHWPGGLATYLLSGLAIIGLLSYETLKSKIDVQLRLIILLYPLSRLIFKTIFSRHLYLPWWFIDLIPLGLIILFLVVRRARSKQNNTHVP